MAVKLDPGYEVAGGKVRRKAKYALPNIETPQPSKASRVHQGGDRFARDQARNDALDEAADLRAQRQLSEERRKAGAGFDLNTTNAREEERAAASGSAFKMPHFKATRRNSRPLLIGEAVMAVVLITLNEVTQGNTPTLRPYMGAFIVYFVLGFAAEVGDDTARLAAAFGALVLLAIAMRSAPAIVQGAAALGIQGTKPTKGATGEAGAPPGGKPPRARVADRKSLRTGARHALRQQRG